MNTMLNHSAVKRFHDLSGVRVDISLPETVSIGKTTGMELREIMESAGFTIIDRKTILRWAPNQLLNISVIWKCLVRLPSEKVEIRTSLDSGGLDGFIVEYAGPLSPNLLKPENRELLIEQLNLDSSCESSNAGTLAYMYFAN